MLISHLNITFRILVDGLYTTWFNIKEKRFCTVTVLCTLFLIAHRRDIRRFVFITEAECVYRELRTGSLTKPDYYHS
jgi:hypothetical protein